MINLFTNKIFLSAFLSWATAQFIKIIIYFIKNNKFDIRLIMGSGGMPSSHTAFVSGLSTAVFIKEGIESTYFAISIVLSFIVMYDATGVRNAAGKQAAAINLILKNIENSNIKLDKELKELIGHTILEVIVGSIVGIIIGFITINYNGDIKCLI